MSIITIEVTQEDIDKGIRSRSDDCAVARALKRQLRTYDVSVSALGVMIHGESYKAPVGLATFVRDFDKDKSLVFPTEFLLDMSATIKYPVFSSAELVGG
jgi:hypothetical protein